MKTEIWKTVKEYEGLYDVSTYGRVRSYVRKGPGFKLDNAAHMLKPSKGAKLENGTIVYPLVSLCKNGRIKQIRVHRLVWETFKGVIPQDKEIAHIDGEYSNCKLSNLACVSHAENEAHKIGHGRGSQGEQNGNAFISQEVAEEISDRYYTENVSQERLGTEYGISRSQVGRIVRGEHWRRAVA
jgi:predicted XRE-type DNA-binding protein